MFLDCTSIVALLRDQIFERLTERFGLNVGPELRAEFKRFQSMYPIIILYIFNRSVK